MVTKTFIIKVKYGGLGDHLFWSHLPRICKSVGGYNKVLISNLSEYRNQEYRKLVWEYNPFIDGFCDDDADCPEYETLSSGMNLLDALMIGRGLDDGKRFHEPEVFYKPTLKAEYVGKNIYDPNYISFVGYISKRKLNKKILTLGTVDYQLQPQKMAYDIPKTITRIQTDTIYDYCNMIYSCNKFLCLSSGGATLAAALGKPTIVFYGYGQKKYFLHSTIHQYVEVSKANAPFIMKLDLMKKRINRKLFHSE